MRYTYRLPLPPSECGTIDLSTLCDAECRFISKPPRTAWRRQPYRTREGAFMLLVDGLPRMRNRKVRPLSERFWAKVDKTDNCWLWTGRRLPGGYGVINAGRAGLGNLRASRVSWELHNGPIPPGILVMHLCDNPPCVNPAHLNLGTQKDNMHDASVKRRLTAGSSHHAAKLSTEDVAAIRARRTAGASAESLATEYGVNSRHIYRVCLGRQRVYA